MTKASLDRFAGEACIALGILALFGVLGLSWGSAPQLVLVGALIELGWLARAFVVALHGGER